TSESIKLIPDYYGVERGRIKLVDTKKINKEYIAYICPFADAFRLNFIKHLETYTEFIKKLKIPFIVPGIGIRASTKKINRTDIDEATNKKMISFPFDKEVHDFIEAVNGTGTILGVRGQTTADYLTNLGFKENTDFMITGCPSMFTFGKHIKIKTEEIANNSTVSLNSSPKAPRSTIKFISKSSEDFDKYYYLPQLLSEFRLSYLGGPELKKKKPFYPRDLKSKFYQDNSVYFPIHPQGWIDFLKKVDFSFGARLHGNITATLAGTPNIIVVKDSRMREVVDYHNLTNVNVKELKKFDSIFDLINSVDLNTPEKGHKNRFKNYLKFWEINNIETIYDEDISRKDAPLDKQINKNSKLEPVPSLITLNKNQIDKRLKKYQYEEKKWEKEKKRKLHQKIHSKSYEIYDKLKNNISKRF
ncbi:MAG: polysaccharide pyruvyl transferase family protein, partial [Methanobrevibacter sp.]|nr:polysaccharide pyruvyl transferase family protein [Methanobrevibacter sp.]